MLGAMMLMLSWPIANAMTLAWPGIGLWSDKHAAMDTEQVHAMVRRLSSDLKHANITSPKVFFYDNVEKFKRDHDWPASEPLEFEDVEERDEVSAASIHCQKAKCTNGPGVGIGAFPSPAYRDKAGNAFCRFVQSVSPNSAGIIGFVGNHATCAPGQGSQCAVRFIVAANNGKLGGEIAGNYANCQDSLQSVYRTCGVVTGRAQCGTNVNNPTYGVVASELTSDNVACQGDRCKMVNCNTSAAC